MQPMTETELRYVLGPLLSISLDLRGFAAKQRARQWDNAGRVAPIAALRGRSE